MKKKLLLLLVLMNLMALGSYAQISNEPIILSEEEAEDIDSLSYLVETMNRHGNSIALDAKRAASWKRKGFFRVAYTNTTMEPTDLPDYLMSGGNVCMDGMNSEPGLYDFKNKVGVSLMWGRSYSLHKKPIANIVRVALDFTWVDLNWNQHNTFYAKDGKKYDSEKKFGVPNDENGVDSCYITPWGLAKNEINYGMSIGPSVTVAPFGSMNTEARNIHIQGYFHVGYSGSVILFKNDKNFDIGNDSGFVGQWGHGLNTCWGINLSWKAIGIGYEHRSGKFSYKSFDTDNYGNNSTKFKYKNSRIYLTYNF